MARGGLDEPAELAAARGDVARLKEELKKSNAPAFYGNFRADVGVDTFVGRPILAAAAFQAALGACDNS